MLPWLLIVIGIAGIAIPLLLYPLALLLLTGETETTQPPLTDVDLPAVDFIITAHNEEKVLREKLQNTLALDYPSDKLKILVVSDGSSDATTAIAREFADRVDLLEIAEQGGKTNAQNRAVAATTQPALVFSDANAIWDTDAVRELVRPLQESRVGVVCGELTFYHASQAAGRQDAETDYWSYERWLKTRESAYFSTIGVNGSIYAVRREAFTELAEWAISDLMLPLLAVAKGWRSVYAPRARSRELSSSNLQVEFKRRRRIIARSVNSIRRYWNEISRGPGKLLAMLFLHKILRWLLPLWLLAFAAGALFSGGVWLTLCGVALLAGLVIAGRIAHKAPGTLLPWRPLNLLLYFLAMNVAVGLGIIDALTGRTWSVWRPQR